MCRQPRGEKQRFQSGAVSRGRPWVREKPLTGVRKDPPQFAPGLWHHKASEDWEVQPGVGDTVQVVKGIMGCIDGAHTHLEGCAPLGMLVCTHLHANDTLTP